MTRRTPAPAENGFAGSGNPGPRAIVSGRLFNPLTILAMFLALSGCQPDNTGLECSAPCSGGPVYALDQIRFVTDIVDGVAAGFDLDGVDSDGDGRQDCGTADLRSPSGTTGIDNKVAEVFSELPPVITNALPGAIQTSISDGGLQILVEVGHLQGFAAPPGPVDVLFWRAAMRPLQGSDGRYLPDQTLTLHADPYLGIAVESELTADRLTGGPASIRISGQFLGTQFDLNFADARFRLALTRTGRIIGLLGAAIPVPDLIDLASKLNGDEEDERRLLTAVIPSFADIRSDGDGDCDRVSAALEVGGTRVFTAGR